MNINERKNHFFITDLLGINSTTRLFFRKNLLAIAPSVTKETMLKIT